MLASHSPTHPPAPVTVHPVRSARWSLLAQALVVGLYLGRVVAETAVQPWPLAWLLPLVAGGLVAGLAVSLLAERYLATGLPLLLLGAYVLWPVASVTWAIGILAAALIVLLMANARALPTPWPEALAVGGGLLLYGSTVSPGLLPADSGEFQLVATVLGIAHPPGYPLYTMVGRLATLLVPLGDPALRLNLLSVLLSALTLGVVAHTVRRRTGSAAAALVAAGALGLSTTFWAQATTANIRALTGLFVALLVALALRWGEERSPRLLWILAGVFGLAVGHHSSLAPLGLPLAGYVLWREPTLLRRPRRWVAPLAALAASFAVLLYLPVRSLWGAPFDPEPIRSLADMAQHVLALGFRGDMFYFRTLPALAARTAVWAQIMRLEFGLPLLVAAGLAAVAVARRDRRAALLVGGILGVNTVLAVTYRAPQTVEYLLPSYVALAVLLGEGLGLAVAALGDHAHGWGRWGAGILVAVLAVAAVGNGWVNWPSFRTLHRDDSTRQAGESLLRDAPPGALVLANWHHTTPLWYLQEVDGLREDVEVVYVYPEGATPNEEVWLRRIDEALDERPVIVTNRFYAYEGADLRFVPYHDAWLVRREPLSEPPEAITAHLAAFGEGEGPPFVTLLGYRLSTETPRAGETLDLRVYWRAEGALPRDYSTFAQLLGPGGVVGQGDIGHRSTEYLPGEVRVDAYRIPLLLHATPGSHRLITGFYYPEGDGWQRLMTGGADHLALADLTVEPADRSFATLHPRVDRFSGGLVLRGADADHTIAGETRLYLHLAEAEAAPVARGPWGADAEAVTLQVSGPDGLLAERALPPLAPGAAVTLAVDLLADVGEVRVALRAADGAVLPRLGPWGRAAGDGVTLRLSDEGHYVPLGGEMAFLGMPGLPAEVPAGGEATLRAAFLALRPLTRDYSVSVGLARPDLGWEAKADGTPALGAIPTLKWVTGWVVEDQHAVPLGGQAPGGAAPGGAAPPGEAAVTLSVYDAFTLEPLNVLDERLVRQGQGTSLRLDTATVRIE